jgi:hypothetical protein
MVDESVVVVVVLFALAVSEVENSFSFLFKLF